MPLRAPRALAAFVGVLLWVAHGLASEPAVTAEVLTPVVEARPNQTLTLRLRFINSGSLGETIDPELAIPAGWQVLVPAESVTLDPGASQLSIITILVPSGARAGSHTVPLAYYISGSDQRHEVLFTVTVPTVDHAELRVLESPELVTASEFTTRFLLENLGNTPHEWVLHGESNLALGVSVTPTSVVLAPGESAGVTARVDVSAGLSGQRSHLLTLTAQSRNLPNVRVSARSQTTLVPRALPATADLHTLPLTIRSSYGGSLNSASSNAGPAVTIEGAGRLAEQDAGLFSVRLQATPDGVLGDVLLRYERPEMYLSVGEQPFTTSLLTSSVTAFGVTGRFTTQLSPSAPLSAKFQAYSNDESTGLTATLDMPLADGVDGGVTLNASTAGLLGSLRVGYKPALVDPTSVQLTSFEAKYGVRVDSEHGLGHGFAGTLELSEGVSFVRMSLESANASFRRGDKHYFSVGVQSSFRMNEALRLRPQYPLNLSILYGSAWSWGTARPFSVVPAGNVDSRAEKYGVGVNLAVGPVSFGSSYSTSFETSAASIERRDEGRGLVRYQHDRGFAVAQSATWIRTWEDGLQAQNTIDHDSAMAVPTGATGGLTASVSGRYDVMTNQQQQLGFSVRWTGKPLFALKLDLGAHYHLIHPSRAWVVTGSSKYRFANDHVLDLSVRTEAHRSGQLLVVYEIGYALPLNVPIGRRADIGRMVGRALTQDGEPIAGMIVTVAGQAVSTDSEGSFVFPALPIGEHTLQVQPNGALAPTQILTPAQPQRVLISEGETTRVELTAVAGAAIRGAVYARSAEQVISAMFVRVPAEVAIRGVRLELCNATGCHQAVTEADGRFHLDPLPPGEWTLRASLPDLQSYYRLEPADQTVRLEPGATVELSVELVPVEERIEFNDGGALTLPATP